MKTKGLTQTSPTVQCVFFLILFSVVNLVLFYGFGHSKSPVRCTTDTVLQVVALYLGNNGRVPVATFMPDECSSYQKNTETEILNSVRAIVQECRELEKKTKRDRKLTKHPLITLFTTHASHSHSDDEKVTVHGNTLLKWASFKSKVNLILFSNDSVWMKKAEKLGWDVVSTVSDGIFSDPPVLKDMFQTAMTKYDTSWYGYVNADILFTNDLFNTLEAISDKYPVETSTVFITGKRTNINNLTSVNISSDDALKATAVKFGTLYREDAEDYFITTKLFPWKHTLPVVVGRPGYDNWLVSEARCSVKATVIDVTDTNIVVHQTTQKGGNHEGYSHTDSLYNIELFKKHNITPNFIAGLTSCIQHRTYSSFCDTILLDTRTDLGKNCECK